MYLLNNLNKISLSNNDHKTIQSMDSIETYVYGTSKHLANKKKKVKCNNIIKQNNNDWFCWCYKRNIKDITQIDQKLIEFQNINNWKLEISKNKCIIYSNKS